MMRKAVPLADLTDQLPTSRRRRRLHPGRPAGVALCAAIAAAIALMLCASAASANDLFTLDPNAVSSGHLIEDAAGNAYIGWVDGSGGTVEVPKFCKIPAGGTCTDPITLPIPAPAGDDIPDQVTPVLGTGSTVYAVGPDYIDHAVVIWTSTNGGASFNGGVIDTSGYPSQGEPNTVLLNGSEFWIGTSHVGVGIGDTPTNGIGGSELEFAAPSLFAGQATLGLASPGEPVEAYWEDENDSPISFYRYKGAGSVTTESDWAGPTLVTDGEAPRLAGGAAGLFLLSDDALAAGGEPEAVHVRKYAGTNFGAPLTLLGGPAFGPQDGGAISESPDGHIAVAWPTGSGGTEAMQLFVSTDDGLSFAAAGPIARLGSGYETGVNAQISLNDDGAGWLTYKDEGGLQVADLAPLPAPAPAPPSTPTTAPATPAATPTKPKKPTTPAPYSGATKTISTPVGGENLQLKLPKQCLASLQPFYVGVGKAKRHGIAKALQTPIEVQKMTFSFDHLKKTLKKKPFRWLVKPPALTAGHQYLVKARVTVTIDKRGKKKSAVKTLKGAVSIC
jgi:hypothetical protein